MQGLLTVLCILLTVTLPSPEAEQIAAKTTSVGVFRWSLIFFIIAAFASATHDIAADGYYMLAHDERSQAAFVGIRSTFYRIASVFSQGVLVYIAGYIENKTGIAARHYLPLFGIAESGEEQPPPDLSHKGRRTSLEGVRQSVRNVLYQARCGFGDCFHAAIPPERRLFGEAVSAVPA